MSPKLQTEIKQTQPFPNLESEAFLNLLRTTDQLTRGVCAVLRSADLSLPQYNVLRILRGSGDSGRTCGEIAERMISQDPDVTRLLDRLEKRGLVTRTRDQRDRRVIHARITAAGRRILAELDEPMARIHITQIGHLGEPRLRQLVALLESARNPE